MAQSFYVPDGALFASTELTRGPWDAGSQHAGPPAALLGRAVEAHADSDSAQVVRITFEILRPVPIAPLQVWTETLRGGRSVQVVGATLSAGGAEVMRAVALLVRTASLPLERLVHAEALPGPAAGTVEDFFPTGWDVGYHTAMEVRFLEGGFTKEGPAVAWMRMRHHLVAGESPSPLCRVLAAADSGNGLSGALDYRKWIFINPDLTVFVHRPLSGEWVGLDARTTVEPHGIGLAESTLFDEQGPIGRGLQSLFVTPR